MYAQTNLQLYRQLRGGGFAGPELGVVHAAYELAARLFAGRFQASGKVFLAHVVGVASILATLRSSAAIVAAGLLHDVYRSGDFGDGRTGASDARRESVRQAVGAEVERYVHRFACLPWTPDTMLAARDEPGRFDSVDQAVLAMRLADLLEHHLDLGVLHYADAEARCARVRRDGRLMIELAGTLGFPALATELGRVFEETVSVEIPPELRDTSGRTRAFVIAPRSYRRRWTAALRAARDRPPSDPSTHRASRPSPGRSATSPDAWRPGVDVRSGLAVPFVAEVSTPYAQTNVQLYRQMQREGCTGPQLALVRRAYELAMGLFAGARRPSGKPNIDHLVGTASVLTSLRVPVELVAAGLLHPAYKYGDFGGVASSASRARRSTLRRAVGPDVERYVARYAALRSDSATPTALHAGFPALDRIGRDVALIRLADMLEDLLDQGILYCSNATTRLRSSQRMRPTLMAMAEELGFPVLAREFDRVVEELSSANVSPELHGRSGRHRVFVLAPRSYRRRVSVALGQELVRGCRYAHARLARVLDHVRQRLRSPAEGVGRAGGLATSPGAPSGAPDEAGARAHPSAAREKSRPTS